MATSSLAAALETPEIVRCIDSCTQLLPGVPASTENLQQLWELISEKKSWSNDEDDVLISIMHQGNRGKKNARLEVQIGGPIETIANDLQGYWCVQRAVIDKKCFEWSVHGLAEALAYAKHTGDRVRRKEFCDRCRLDGLNKTEKLVCPVKKLKAHGLPYCAACTLDLAVGGPPQKKARIR